MPVPVGFYHSINLYRRFLTYSIAPLVFIIAIWLAKYMRSGKDKERNDQILAQHVNAILMTLFFFAPIVSSVTFKLFVSAIALIFRATDSTVGAGVS